jgi:chromosome segregation and condensation protein ScpB
MKLTMALGRGLALCACATALLGCEREPTADKGLAERAGERIDQALDRAGEGLNKVAERTGKNLQEFGRRLQAEAREAREERVQREQRQANRETEASSGE